MAILMYWEDVDNRPKPFYYELCMETVLRHNDEVRIIGRDEAADIVGGEPPEVAAAYIAHRSDWYRKMLLWKLGGLYVDADFICFENLRHLHGLCLGMDFVGYKEWNAGWMDNFVGCRSGSPLMRLAADNALGALRHRNVAWTAPSCGAVTAAFDRLCWLTKWVQLPTHLVNPVNVTDAGWFMYDGDREVPDHRLNAVGYMTSAHSLGDWLGKLDRDKLMNGTSRLKYILTYALR